MGGAASQNQQVTSAPQGPQPPAWLQEIKVQKSNIKDNPLLQESPKFKTDLPHFKIEHEFAAKVSLECSKRCLYSIISNDDDSLNYAEKLCMHRCVSKLYKAREVVENKLEGHIEKPPILFAQNLPM